MTESKWLPSTRFSEISHALLKGGQKQYTSRLKTLAENLVEEKEKEEKKDFKEILADILNAEEEAQLAETEEGEGEEGEEEADPEDENYPGRESAPRGEKQVDGVGEDLDSEELIKEYADLGEDEEDKAFKAAKEAAEKKKKLLAKAKAEKAEMDKKRKRLGVSSIKDAEEEAYDEIEDMNDAIEEGTDYDEDSGPLPLTKDNILDTIGAIDPRLGVAVAGIRGIEDAINHPGSTADKMAAFGKTLGFGAINSVLGMVGLEMTPEQWQTATDKVAYGFEKVFAPGAASAKEAKWAQEEGQRAAAAQIQAATQKVQYKKFEVSAKANLDDARKFEALVDAVDGGGASDQQKADLAQITREWDEIDNGTAEQARQAYILYARRQKQTEANQTYMAGDYNVANVNAANQSQTATGLQQFNPRFGPATLENQPNIRTTCAELGVNTENLAALEAQKAKAEAMPNSGLSATIRNTQINVVNQQIDAIKKGLDYYDFAKGRYEKYQCRSGNYPEPYYAKAYGSFEGMGVATPAPDGKGVYLAPFSNPFTGDFPWNAIYSEAEGIVPEFEAWFYFVVGQENTPAQKRTRLMRTLSIKTTPAFTAWMSDWYEKITIYPFPNPDRSWSPNFTWVEFIPPSYPILPFSQQYEAFTQAMTRWLAIINDQARYCVDYQQINVLYDAGIIPAQRFSSRPFQDVINERSDSPDTIIDPYQGGLTWRAIRGGLVFAPPAPPGLLNYLWTWYGIPQPTYTDPDTGLTISSFTTDGRAKTSEEINNEMNAAKGDLQRRQAEDLARQEAERKKQEEIQARAAARQDYVKKYGEDIAKKEQSIQANASLKAQFEFIKKIHDEYQTAEGFAKRHWYDREAARSGGQVLLFKKAVWDDEEPQPLYTKDGYYGRQLMENMLFNYYRTNDPNLQKKDTMNYRSVPYNEARLASLKQVPNTLKDLEAWRHADFKEQYKKAYPDRTEAQLEQYFNYMLSQGALNIPMNYETGEPRKDAMIEDIFRNENTLQSWQAYMAPNFPGKTFDFTEPPTSDELEAGGFWKAFEDKRNTMWEQSSKGRNEVAGYYSKDGDLLRDRGGVSYAYSETTWGDIPSSEKTDLKTRGLDYPDDLPANTPFVRLTPGGTSKKMEETEDYQVLIDVWNATATQNKLFRRFKAEEWGEDKQAKANDMVFLESDMILMEGDNQYISPKVGYIIPLMTYLQWREYAQGLLDKDQKPPGGGNFPNPSSYDDYIGYVIMKNFEASSDANYTCGLGNVEIDISEEKKKHDDLQNAQGQREYNPAVKTIKAGRWELSYRISVIQYPDALKLIMDKEMTTTATGSGVGGCKECKAHPALMDYTCFSKGKGQPSRPKKKMSAEHLAKLQEGRKKYQAQKQREKRLY